MKRQKEKSLICKRGIYAWRLYNFDKNLKKVLSKSVKCLKDQRQPSNMKRLDRRIMSSWFEVLSFPLLLLLVFQNNVIWAAGLGYRLRKPLGHKSVYSLDCNVGHEGKTGRTKKEGGGWGYMMREDRFEVRGWLLLPAVQCNTLYH